MNVYKNLEKQKSKSMESVNEFTSTQTKLNNSNEELKKVLSEINDKKEFEEKRYNQMMKTLNEAKEETLIQITDNEGVIKSIDSILNGNN